MNDRWGWVRRTLGVCLAMAVAVVAAPRIAAADGSGSKPDVDVELAIVCGKHVSKELVNARRSDNARFTISKAGDDMQVADGKGMTFCFARDDFGCEVKPRCKNENGDCRPDLIVRIDRVAPRGRETIACQKVKAGWTYDLADDKDVRSEDALIVSEYADPTKDEQPRFEQLRSDRKKVLQKQIGAAEARHLVWNIADGLRSNLSEYLAVSGHGAPPVNAVDALKHVEEAEVEWGCAGAKCDDPRSPYACYPGRADICKGLRTLSATLSDIKSALPNDLSALSEALSHLSSQLGQNEPQPPKGHCDDVAKYAWLTAGDHYRLLAREMVAKADPDQMHVLQYDVGTDSMTLPSDERPILLFENVPVDATPHFDLKHGDEAAKDPAVAIATFMTQVASFALKAAVSSQKAGVQTFAFTPQIPDSVESRLSRQVQWTTEGKYAPYCSKVTPRVDDKLLPIAPVGTRVYRVPEKLDKREITVHVCAGDKCKTEGDDANVTNTVEMTPESRCGLVVLAGFGAGLRLDVRDRKELSLEPVGGTVGPDQVFEVQSSKNVKPLATFDLLLGARFHDNMVIAFGPSVVGRGIEPFEHWKLSFGGRWPAFSRYVYFLASAGVAIKDRLRDVSPGDRYVVPMPADGQAKAPDIPTERRAVWTIGVTLGLDINALGAAGEKLVDAFKGGGK